MARKLVVIGGTAAGLSAASKAKRLKPELDVTVYERGHFVSTGSCGLPYLISGAVRTPQDLLSLSLDELRSHRGLDVQTRCDVTGVDFKHKTVEVVNLESGQLSCIPWDDLVFATGAQAIRPDLPGSAAKGTFVLRTLEDGIALKNAVERGVGHAVVVGGGLVGLEMAEQFVLAGMKVTVVEALPRLLPMLESEHTEKIQRCLENHGVTLELDSLVSEVIVDEAQNMQGLKLSTGKIILADLLLWSVGVTPATSLAEKSGLSLGIKKAIVVNEYMSASVPHVWACGDCAQSYHSLTGQPCWVPQGTTANKQGRVAGSNIGGEKVSFPGVLGSQASRFFDLYIAATGLSLSEAHERGYDALSTTIVKGDLASYYPGGQDSQVTLIFERHQGKILGAQASGGFSVAGRINVLVGAIHAGMTVSQLHDFDLLYSPVIAPVYDPLLIAAAQAMKQVVK